MTKGALLECSHPLLKWTHSWHNLSAASTMFLCSVPVFIFTNGTHDSMCQSVLADIVGDCQELGCRDEY